MRPPDGKLKDFCREDSETKKIFVDGLCKERSSFNEKLFTLEDEAKEVNIFAKPLLKVFNRFAEADQERPEVRQDPNMSNTAHFVLKFPGSADLISLGVMEWARLEARSLNDPDYDDAWFEEQLPTTNMVRLDSEKCAAGMYLADSSVLLQWLSRDIKLTEQVGGIQFALDNIQDGVLPMFQGNQYPFPAADMAEDSKSLMLPLDTGFHW